MDAYEKVTRIDTLDNAFLNELLDYSGYGSRGTINMVVSLLVTLKERIQRGDKIKLEKTGERQYSKKKCFPIKFSLM